MIYFYRLENGVYLIQFLCKIRKSPVCPEITRYDRKTVIGTPKSRSSCRVIALCDQAINILLEQKRYQKELQNAIATKDSMTESSTFAGTDDPLDNVVFTGRTGDRMSGDYLNNCFRKMMADAGYPGMHIHDLRHANASLLINEGVPLKIVSRHLGHASTQVTEQVYIHLFEETQKQTASVIQQIFR